MSLLIALFVFFVFMLLFSRLLISSGDEPRRAPVMNGNRHPDGKW